MQINHNIRAMVTQHSLFQNNNSMTKSLEKLSTGLRINRAQDDAAGLAMSEQMRGQIRGLGKAKQNAQDGQAALQIAEGALGEITNMMQRQKELAVQSANDTLTVTERKYLNDEFQALNKEIDRIAKTTDYNGKNVLLFDMDSNKSFGATKLNPYSREVATLEASSVIYKVFGANLTSGSLSEISKTYAGVSGAPGTANTAATALNTVIQNINKVITDSTTGVVGTTGILTEDNIRKVLSDILAAGSDKTVVEGSTTIKLGGDEIWTGAIDANVNFQKLTADDQKAIKEANAFLNNVQNALNYLDAAEKGETNARAGADAALTALKQAWNAHDMITLGSTGAKATGIASIDSLAKQLDTAVTANKIADVAAIFNSAGGQKAYQELMQIDTSKMESGTKAGGTTGEKIQALQKQISDLYDVAKIYSEGATAVGTAASDLLHVTPNYSRGLGGSAASEIKVNYSAIDIRGLGLQAQSIDSQEGATKAIDRLDEVIKVVSGNRAAIGTYINRLDYTVNNIASMEYNTQDAESRIRDTDFATETTNFTKNQIMVQSATSMLAQANMLPQSVLSLIG